MITDWNSRFSTLAESIASWSKDPSSKIGAIAVDPTTHRILSTGYNGFPKGIVDTQDRLTDRPTKYKLIVHAEANCIYNATFSGTSLNGSHLYVYGLPVCSECAKAVISVGVSKVFVKVNGSVSSKWQESWETSSEMFKEAGVEVEIISCL
jgi:dCMP deaminase